MTRRESVLTTWPRQLKLDMLRIVKVQRATMFGVEGLAMGNDLLKIKLVAQNRDKWKRNVEIIREAALKK